MTYDWIWHGKDERILTVIPQVNAVAVYQSEHDYVVIRQRDELGGDDPCVILPPHRVPDLIRALQSMHDQITAEQLTP